MRLVVFIGGLAILMGVIGSSGAEPQDELAALVERCVPACRFQTNSTGDRQALISASGEVLDLAKAAGEDPASAEAIGYWESPAMQFLGRQQIKAGTSTEARDAIRLLHMIWRGPGFVRQKLYEAHAFDGGWVVEVDHDFTHYPGSVQAVMPYELLVDGAHRVAQMRERCYSFRGSAKIYTNTVISVYEREKKIQGGIYYPEVLENELRKVWEQEQTNGGGGTIGRKQ